MKTFNGRKVVEGVKVVKVSVNRIPMVRPSPPKNTNCRKLLRVLKLLKCLLKIQIQIVESC